jgi:hypothetical protein
VATVEQAGVPGVQAPYGSAMSMAGYDAPVGYAEGPHASGHSTGGRGTSGASSNCEVGP